MTKEKQRIVIAEFCGAKHVQFLGKKAWTFESYPNPENLLCPMEHGECLIDVPNYPNDLNAMHKAEKLVINDSSNGHCLFGSYLKNLEIIVLRDRDIDPDPSEWNAFIAFATAAQRSEAFVKTLGLWEQD